MTETKIQIPLVSSYYPFVYPKNKNGTTKRSEMSDRGFLTVRERFKEDKKRIKEIFNRYEQLGEEQIASKKEFMAKVYAHAAGRIDPRDYIDIEDGYKTGIDEGKYQQLNSSLLKYYPIIPVVVRAILGAYNKVYSEFSAVAVNPEHSNSILEMFDAELKSILVQGVEEMFLQSAQGRQIDPAQQQQQMVARAEEFAAKYSSTYRSEVELWAMHRMNIEDQMYHMKQLEVRLLEQLIISGDPVIHVNLSNGNYQPEVWDEKNIFFLQSPSAQDYSEAQMVGYVEWVTLSDILNRWGDSLPAKEVEKSGIYDPVAASTSNSVFSRRLTDASNWESKYLEEGTHYAHYNWQEHEDNYAKVNFFNTVLNDARSKYGAGNVSLAQDGLHQLTTIYFYIPRKIGQLTVRTSDGQEYTDIVDEYYRVTMPTVYEDGQTKSAETLIKGEHIDWFYRNELYRGVKLSVNTSNINSINTGLVDELNDLDKGIIWLELDKLELQFMNPMHRYSTYIPVHGGGRIGHQTQFDSPVAAASVWAEIFNWVQNRNNQLLRTEIGRFFVTPEALIPRNDLEGEFGKNDPLTDFAVTARDIGVVTMANPMNQVGGTVIASQGIGQVIDLTKTNELLEKSNYAEIVKRECYAAMGVTPEFVFGDYSPEQSGQSVALGQQRIASQLQVYFQRVSDIMCKARSTMLQAAKYLEQNKPTTQMTYLTTDGVRQIFRTSTMDFSLTDLGVFVRSNGADMSVIESIKRYVASNNTMGADSSELATLMSFNSLPELFSKLKNIKQEKALMERQKFEQQMQLQQQADEAAKQREQMRMEEERLENALDRESRIMEAQIKALGYANDTADNIQERILQLRTANDAQRELDRRAEADLNTSLAAQRREELNREDRRANLALSERVKMKQLEQKDRELELREMEIAARNNRTKALD